jgi:hypothetical protein
LQGGWRERCERRRRAVTPATARLFTARSLAAPSSRRSGAGFRSGCPPEPSTS